jgi:hypothetical protein
MAMQTKADGKFPGQTVKLQQVRITRKGDMFQVIIKATNEALEPKIKFADVKSLDQVGDILSMALVTETWKDEKPFDLGAWQAKNRKAL